MTTLAVSGLDAARILARLDGPDETAWVLSARRSVSGELLTGRQLHDVPATAYRERTASRLTIASPGFVPAFGRALRDGGLPIFIHTHPHADPSPSELDDEVDRLLADHATARGCSGYGAVILGGTAAHPRFTGRLYPARSGAERIDRLRVAGRDARLWLADDLPVDEPVPIFDRHVRAFGADGQRLLEALRIGVVGAGGTGSAVIEQLARLGVGELVVIDDDNVDDTNLTRIHGSTAADVGTPKAELASSLATSFGTGTRARPIIGNAASREGVELLRTCDVVYGCTDEHAARLVLSRLAYHYLIPVIDCGVVVDVASEHVRGVVGRVTLMAPNEPCLLCRGQVDPRLASEEMMDPERRRALAGEGYARGAQGPAPAVVAFTTATAALAVNEMLARLLGYATSSSTQILLRLDAQTIARAGRPAVIGHLCVTPDDWGVGDTQPPLGMVGLR